MSCLVQNDTRITVKCLSYLEGLVYFLLPMTLVLVMEVSGAMILEYSLPVPLAYNSHDDRI